MRLLFIGQTPPPYGGQTINIGKMVNLLETHNYNFKFVRMDFSADLRDTGKLSFIKLWRLLKIFCSICYHLITYRPKYVYYPVAGPNKVPVIRDIILLLPIRLLRKKVVFHFHAGGLSEIYPLLGNTLKKLYRYAYFKPFYSICMSNYGKRDPEFLQSEHITIIPYGVSKPHTSINKSFVNIFNVLFVAVCKESKGILDYLKAIRLAHAQNPQIKGIVMGESVPGKIADEINAAVADGLITYEGVKVSAEKQAVFLRANAFLFPTFFEAENFPTVNLEAFSYGLPVMSTRWRGVNDQVTDGINGFLHDLHDVEAMAASILTLSGDEDLYVKMSASAYQSYQDNYTSEIFDQRVLTLFNSFT